MERKLILDLRKNLIISVFEFSNNMELSHFKKSIKNKKIHGIIMKNFENLDHFISNPRKLKMFFKISNLECRTLANASLLYESIQGLIILAYPTIDYKVSLLNVSTLTNLTCLTGCKGTIFCIRHFKNLKEEYLLTGSEDFSIRVWNMIDYACIVNINKSFTATNICSCLIVSLFNTPYIIGSVFNTELMKVFDFIGNYKYSIGCKKEKSIYIDEWRYQNDLFIINSNDRNVKLYNFETGQKYRYFKEKKMQNSYHYYAKIVDFTLIECDNHGKIRFWDVLSEKLLKTIFIEEPLCSFLIWNNTYLIATSYVNHRFNCLIIDQEHENIDSFNSSNLNSVYKYYDINRGEVLVIGGNDSIFFYEIQK